MSLHATAIVPMAKTLSNVEAWLDQAEAHAEALGFEADSLLDARLFPNQFPLVRQLQAAADTLKLAVARITGQAAPKHDDSERTFSEIRERLRATLSYVEGIQPSAYDGTEGKMIELPFAKGMSASAADFVREFSLPNFYFHVTHAYAILRANGVPLGKRAFIGSMTMVSN